MKQIRLENMELRNFKGVQHQAYAFDERTAITGGNGTGKSTIFEAYLWCLFDKTPFGEKPKVQPLDTQNQIIHDLVTEVIMTLVVDGNQMKVARKMNEKKGGGTESAYYVNDVPMTQTQFKAKMSEIGDLDRWFMISSINIIPAMEQKVCRAALQDIAPAFDEMLLAKKYKNVYEALTKGYSVDELAKVAKADKLKAKADLDAIPAAMDAQDRLRVEDDFKFIAKRLKDIETETGILDAKIDDIRKVKVDSATVAKEEERRKRMADLNKTITDAEREVMDGKMKIETEHNTRLQNFENTIKRAESDIRNYEGQLASISGQAERYAGEVERIRDEWRKKNAEDCIVIDHCPTCGQVLPDSKIEELKNQWNTEKAEALAKINANGKATRATLDRLQAEIEDINENIGKCRVLIAETQDAQDEYLSNYHAPVWNDMLAENAAWKEAKALYDALLEEMKSEVDAHKGDEEAREALIEPLMEQKRALIQERAGLEKRLAAKATNERIDEERKRLEKKQVELAQAIADYEAIEADIAGFRKAKIQTVEDGVSSLFTMVRWKMYEPNVSNDGEKEICQPIIEGIPYQMQNTAMQYNAGLDIVNGFAKAYGVSVPLFIDGAESVTKLIETDNQLITLAVKDGSKLEIA